MLDMSLEIRANTLEKSLADFTAKERLSGDNKYFCEKCTLKRDADKQFTIFTPPNVLVFHLKRFSFGARGFGGGGKISKHVRFESKIDIRQHCSNSKTPSKYSLIGVLVHSGFSLHSGHYYSYVKAPNGQWYCMNDSSVRRSTLTEALQQKAYMLFYLSDNKQEPYKSPRSSPRKVPPQNLKPPKATLTSAATDTEKRRTSREVPGVGRRMSNSKTANISPADIRRRLNAITSQVRRPNTNGTVVSNASSNSHADDRSVTSSGSRYSAISKVSDIETRSNFSTFSSRTGKSSGLDLSKQGSFAKMGQYRGKQKTSSQMNISERLRRLGATSSHLHTGANGSLSSRSERGYMSRDEKVDVSSILARLTQNAGRDKRSNNRPSSTRSAFRPSSLTARLAGITNNSTVVGRFGKLYNRSSTGLGTAPYRSPLKHTRDASPQYGNGSEVRSTARSDYKYTQRSQASNVYDKVHPDRSGVLNGSSRTLGISTDRWDTSQRADELMRRRERMYGNGRTTDRDTRSEYDRAYDAGKMPKYRTSLSQFQYKRNRSDSNPFQDKQQGSPSKATRYDRDDDYTAARYRRGGTKHYL